MKSDRYIILCRHYGDVGVVLDEDKPASDDMFFTYERAVEFISQHMSEEGNEDEDYTVLKVAGEFQFVSPKEKGVLIQKKEA